MSYKHIPFNEMKGNVSLLETDRFDFFETECAKSRYAIAAYHLRDCDHIIDIGSALTAIDSFLIHEPTSVIVIDPVIDSPGTHGIVTRVKAFYQDYDFSHILKQSGKKGVMVMGFMLKADMNVWGPNDDLNVLRKLFTEMDVVVLEAETRPTPGYKNYVKATEMMIDIGFQKRLELNLMMEHVSDFEGDWKDYIGKNRQYMLFEK